MNRARRSAIIGLLTIFSIQTNQAGAAEALVAVAANFATTAIDLKRSFESSGEHRIVLSSGSTGKLYAQIVNGAPYDVFLAADKVRPERLEADGFVVEATRRPFASGQLGIWIRDSSGDTDSHPSRLVSLRRVAIANPDLAPYGQAAMNTIDHLAIRDKLAGRLATGENVAQAYAMIASGAAEGGLVAWSLILAGGKKSESWPVPESWFDPIEQDAVLLKHGAENAAATAFLAYLHSSEAQAIIRSRGYLVPDA